MKPAPARMPANCEAGWALLGATPLRDFGVFCVESPIGLFSGYPSYR
jgi:hypothetical protein